MADAWKYDVVIVGAGPAGITAAIALARAEIPVLVIEAGVFPGAENWSGAVYFTENLASPDVLGDSAVAGAAWERRVTMRGFHLYNGQSLAGVTYRNPAAFANCYTVFRPTFDHYLAELARSLGATILTETTVDGLMRAGDGRVIGVHTDRGGVLADVVFLAEGDASQLVSKEGYESPAAGAPHCLQGIREVIELAPEEIERRFQLPREEGAAYEILLRNGSVHQRPVALNMGGFVYTNRASLSLGLVLPLDNLAHEFGGDHNRLMEWFKALPEIRRWTGGGRSVAYGAKIIRGGGFRELPQLVDDGLAIGGAATGIGLDFPYPNFTGPATAMGRLFAHAVQVIRHGDGQFSRSRLEELYEQPLRQTHYFCNVEFLQAWPRYVEQTRMFFGRTVDLATGSLYIASHPELRGVQKLWQLAKFLRETLPPRHWRGFVADLREQREALGLGRIGKLSVIGDQSSADRLPAGTVTFEFSVDGQSPERFLWPVSHFVRSLPCRLAAAADHLYRNDDTPLSVKLRRSILALRHALNPWDYLVLGGFGVALLVLMPVQWLCELLNLVVTRPSPQRYLAGFFQRYRALIRQRTDLSPGAVRITQPWEEKLALIRYFSEKQSHIKVVRPEHFEQRAQLLDSVLWHVCPAKVYECHPDDFGQSQLVVNFENCVKCETCWRIAPQDVDWTRQRRQRLIYSAPTEANRVLLEVLKASGANAEVRGPRSEVRDPRSEIRGPRSEVRGPRSEVRDPRSEVLSQGSLALAAKLRQFCDAVYEGPRYLDAGRIHWLLHLFEQAERLKSDIPGFEFEAGFSRLQAHARRHRFFWAEADARQLLERLGADGVGGGQPSLRAEYASLSPAPLRARLDALFTKQSIKDLEHGQRMTDEQLAFLKTLELADRADVLRELGRKDPSLALLVSGLYSAQIAARPELAGIPWIGLTAARTHWREFPAPSPTPSLMQAATDLCAISLGAGEMLLERCRTHALGRVQFPGLFKDEDGRDGVAKFGAVKALLGEMEAQRYLLEALLESEGGDRSDRTDRTYCMVKILAAEAFGPAPGSFAYNAGQIIGGSAYSEDDIFAKFYRDSVCFSRLLYDDVELRHQLGPEAGARLRAFALEAVSRRAAERGELEAEIVKMLERTRSFVLLRMTNPDHDARTVDAAEELGAQILEHGYPEQALASPPPFRYRSALETGQRYDYGDFLVGPVDSEAWRYVPEMLWADTELRAYHEMLHRFFTERYANRRFDGQSYARRVESLHQLPAEDVPQMVAHGFTRLVIPTEVGGEGLFKAHYYILCSLSMRHADSAYALTIMAHTSIGTTPVLLALEHDLPRAKTDLELFLADESQISDLKFEIQRLLRMVDSPQALKVKDAFTALGQRIKAGLGKQPLLRSLASGFLAHFMEAGRAGLRMDLDGFRSELRHSLSALEALRPRATAIVTELDRRAEAARLFLRLVSAGQISAFALTEPNAGSDSGGVQTRAELKRVEVREDADGVLYFQLGPERKNILDATRLEFDWEAPATGRICYRYAADQPAAPIHSEDYDYATSAGVRWYRHGDRRVNIHDIAQVRREDSRAFYEYYELNGAKMWITNAHVAGLFCLYAHTADGPTGFMVDRHAEGLVVGKDEEKMGQRGSPTNELSLSGVRVPRENIIGLEGRGQVNALETLNVGRTGLCVTAAAMSAKVIEQTRGVARARGVDRQRWVQRLVGEMALEQYAVESLAYELIGRFDHPGTRSVRTESAIGKYYASEALHRVIGAAEQIYGIEGATQLHELEKQRRDARVLNIYEGTNEVQRFLILRDLVDSILPRWKDRTAKSEERGANGAEPLDQAKQRLRQDARAAVDTFGPQVWQNAGFQPTMFKLADMAGYLKLTDSVWWRTQWLRRQIPTDAPPADRQHLALAEQAAAAWFDHAGCELDRLHAEFERDLALLRQGIYPPEVRTAFLALQQAEFPAPRPPIESPVLPIGNTGRLAVVLNIVPVLSPQPRVWNGALLETCFEFDAASRTALARAVGQAEHVTAIAVGPRYGAELLQRALAVGADEAVLLETDDLPADIHATARLVTGHLASISGRNRPCELVLCGDALLGTVLAGDLGFAHRRVTAGADWAGVLSENGGPRVVTMPAEEEVQQFTANDFFAALAKPLTIFDTGQMAGEPRYETRFLLPQVASRTEETPATPEAAAALVRQLVGASTGLGAAETVFDGVIELVDPSRLPRRDAAIFLATNERTQGVETASECAGRLLLPFHVVAFGRADERAIRQLAGRVAADSIYFVTNPNLAGDAPGALLAALRTVWKDTLPTAVIAGEWANDVLARFAPTFPRVQAWYNVVRFNADDGAVEAVWPVFGRRVQRAVRIGSLRAHPVVMTVAAGAEGGRVKSEERGASGGDDGPRSTNHESPTTDHGKRVYQVPLEFEYDRAGEEFLQESAAAGARITSLVDAEVIVDVGYAIRNREHFEAIVTPLRKRLEAIGVKNVMIGGTRKVVEELKLLGAEQQIGQTGTSVNPRLLIALGVSGAPQHLDYLGDRATIIAFNRDAAAPLLTLNQRRTRPRVVPMVGDLFELVPRFTAALGG